MVRRRKIDKTVGDNIRKIMKGQSMSIVALAGQLEMSRQLLEFKLREGRFYYSDVEAIAAALKVTVAELSK